MCCEVRNVATGGDRSLLINPPVKSQNVCKMLVDFLTDLLTQHLACRRMLTTPGAERRTEICLKAVEVFVFNIAMWGLGGGAVIL